MSRHRGRSTQTRRTASCLKPIQQVGSPTHARSTDRQKCATSCMIAASMSPCDTRFASMCASSQPQRACDGRYQYFVTVGADSHFDLAREIYPFNHFKKCVSV